MDLLKNSVNIIQLIDTRDSLHDDDTNFLFETKFDDFYVPGICIIM